MAVSAQGLGKCYLIGELQKYKTLRDQLASAVLAPARWGRAIFAGDSSAQESEPPNKIWALKDVSFTVKKGEAVGIIGRNGAGKSTLLKILSRITEPSEGRGEIFGRVGSLLEVGTGFHPELTGRENIFLNAAILGMRKDEIKDKFDGIVNFAEIDKFIDTPVKHYSSGMYVRLAFAVAAHLEPEILLVDEVLAVGDAAFQKKCLGKMGEVAQEGRTVLFVSHNMGAVRAFCDRAILIDRGRLAMDGDTSDVISAYLSNETVREAEGEIEWEEATSPGGDELRLRAIRLLGPDQKVSSIFEVDKPIKIEITYQVKQVLRNFRLRIALLTSQGEIAFQTTDHNTRAEEIGPGIYKSTCVIPGYLLNIGQYFVRVGGGIPGVKLLLRGKEYLGFQTDGAGNQGSNFPEHWPGAVCPRLEWHSEKVD